MSGMDGIVRDGESPFEFHERQNGCGNFGSLERMEQEFDLGPGVAKSIWLTNRAFKRAFISEQIAQQLECEMGSYGAFAWLRKKYNPDSDLAWRVVDEFNATGALGPSFDVMCFDDRVSEGYREKLETLRAKYAQSPEGRS